MTSDEIIKKAFEKYHEDEHGGIILGSTLENYIAGYTQGRADAGKDIATLFSLLTDYERENIMAQYCVCGSKNTRCQCLLTDYERENIMAQYCVCGSKNTRCQCQNDE